MNTPIDIVFPCAGKAERFGNTFKPFLKIGDLTFIEKAVEPFLKWESLINKFHFIITEEQEKTYSVSEKMHSMFSNIEIEIHQLKQQTDGPLETFVNGYINNTLKNLPLIVCDCDHSIQVDPLFKNYLHNNIDQIIIPTWSITPEIQKNWSKILIKDGQIENFVNKEDVDFDKYIVKGIIGCILFRDASIFKSIKKGQTNFYELIREQFLSGVEISLCEIENAYFYGDFEMLRTCVEKRRSECTIFCDIDGVLLEHNNHSTNDPEMNKTIEGFEILQQLHEQGHKIVLTTARNKKFKRELRLLLNTKEIYYDELVMSCKPGPRVLINDRKPSKPFTTQANSFETQRDKGIGSLSVDKIVNNNNMELLKDISSNSFAKTFILKNNNKIFVRKVISKSHGLKHVGILKRQKADLERFNFMCDGLSPQVYKEAENDLEYFYDMEYLSDYIPLSELKSDYVSCLHKAINLLKTHIYTLSTEVSPQIWLESFLKEKIYSKFEKYSLTSEHYDAIINNHKVTINNIEYYGIKKCLEMIDRKNLGPNRICIVHGDLTIENIMIDKEKNIKFIDMDGSRMFDARELDLGKLSQSILSEYDSWKNLDGSKILEYGSDDSFITTGKYFQQRSDKQYEAIVDIWSNILQESKENVKRKCIFYMCTYFIRFVPFREKLHPNHGVYALLMATVWLNKLLGENYEN